MKKKLHLLFVGSMVLLLVACSSARADKPVTEATASNGETSAPVATDATALLAVKVQSDPVPAFVLETRGSAAYTSYSPQSNVFVVDLPRTVKAADFAQPDSLPSLVSSVSADEAVELGKPLTRVTFRFTKPVHAKADGTGKHLVVSFEPTADAAAEAAAVPVQPDSAESDSAPSTQVAETETIPTPAVAAPAPEKTTVESAPIRVAEEPAATNPATVLKAVATSGSGSSLQIDLAADGSVHYSTMKLSNPLRLVVDLKGLRDSVGNKTYELGDPYVKRIRVAQFQSTPEPVTRVVLDLDEMVDPHLRQVGSSLRLDFSSLEAGTADGSEAVAAAAVKVTPEKARPESQNAVVTRNVDNPATAEAEDVFAADDVPVIASNANQKTGTEKAVIRSSSEPSPPAEQAQPVPPPPAPGTINPAGNTVSAEMPQSTVTEHPVEPPDVRNTGGDIFQTPKQQKISGETTEIVAPGGQRTLSATEPVWVGEPIDLNLKDADIKDVLRTFAQLTGLNIAIDPQVSGTVTVQFTGVPWDQAFDLILRQNGLTFVQEGNLIRVGTIQRLTAEQGQRRALAEQERLNVPTTTLTRRLSYAKATDVVTLLKDMASPRGKLSVDARTNQLIITEIPEVLKTMANLIDAVDIPTPQVLIEARIVETTKNFTRNLGIEWGFNGNMDPALGTGTGLVFPNHGTVTGGPFDLGAGANPVLSLSLGNVLNTFNLDVTLLAAENEGLIRVVSAPKVTTQDNQTAEIQSGVQIPIQTRVNFTTTVTYIDATLRLNVTPQITAEGTVIMDIQVQKVEPAIALNIAGGTNAPLITRRAQTRLMVRDGGTTVIGGIYQATDNSGQDRIPFLSQIPVLGNLFKNSKLTRTHDELLIFITPHILKNS
ncbi:MAG: type IV pilus secretin PilQ [Thermoanaerobaculia bacterium]